MLIRRGKNRMKQKRRFRMKKTGLSAAVFLTVLLLLFPALAEDTAALKPFSSETGYTYVCFGRYPQSIDGGNQDDGTTTWSWRKKYRDWEEQTRKELGLKKKDPLEPFDPGPLNPDPILWRVLSADTEKIYLMSEYVLFASPVHPSMTEYRENGKDFGNTALCAKLNGEFAETAFTDAEMEALVPFGAYGKISLPSGNDLNDSSKGFSKKKLQTRKAMATEYAVRVTGLFVYQVSTGNHSPYWLREQADSDPRQARSTKQTGSVGRLHCDAADVGARPVIQLKPGTFQIESGSGTKEDPYMLSALEQYIPEPTE